MTDDEISEEDALAMLDFHSKIHNVRMIGAFLWAFGAGAGFAVSSTEIYGWPGSYHYGVAGTLMFVGAGLAFLGPRALFRAVRGGVDDV